MNNEIKSILTNYFNLYNKLDKLGGPEVDGFLFEEVLKLEDEALEKFGLPVSDKNRKILWKFAQKVKLTDKCLVQILEQLQAAAERHLFAPVLTDLEQLQKGKEQNRSAFDVLPELGYPTHDYTIFLYDTILPFESPEEVLAELSALKRLDCYGEIFTLKNKHTNTFRKTKVYKQLKPYLKFLDSYLALNEKNPFYFPDTDEEIPHPLSVLRLLQEWVEEEKPIEKPDQLSLFSGFKRAEAIDFKPDYIVLTDLVIIEEIMFSCDSAVTVTGKLCSGYHAESITLGFEFEQLTRVIQAYRKQGQKVLDYFNPNRQRAATDEPVIINLKDKTGEELALREHYFKVFKPLSLDRDGKPTPMEEAFYIVEEIIDKDQYDQEQVDYLKYDLQGYSHHMGNHYYAYLYNKHEGKSEEEARRANGLEDQIRFKISKLFYLLHKHGGKIR